jgi:hypothetical protein
MPFTWALESLMEFFRKKLSVEKTLALELANGILSKWEDNNDRRTKTMFYVACLVRNKKLVDDMKSGDLSIDTFFSMSPHELQTETNKKKKKENMLQAMEDAIITEEMTRVCDVYVMGQMEWRGQQKQKMSYAKPENVEKI